MLSLLIINAIFGLDVLKSGGRIRLVGDNINWHVSVRDERINHSGFMRNGFATIVIVQNGDFSHLESTCPQRNYASLSACDFIPSVNDIFHVKHEYCILIARAAAQIIPCFQHLQKMLDQPIQEAPRFMHVANKVLPFNVVMKNEQKYSETVEILDSYEALLKKSYEKANVSFEHVKVHCGGDQMTRERFSGAKCLRANHTTPEASFSHLGPITFELFHQHMNFVKNTFDDFFHKDSACDVGTLKFFQERLSRPSVNGDVVHHYDAHKELLSDVTKVYCVLAVMQHFGMNNLNDSPTKYVDVKEASIEEQHQWFLEQIRVVVDQHLHVGFALENVEGKFVCVTVLIT